MKYHPEDTHWFICAVLNDGTVHQELRLNLADAHAKYAMLRTGASARSLGLGKKEHRQTWLLIDAEIARWAEQKSAKPTRRA